MSAGTPGPRTPGATEKDGSSSTLASSSSLELERRNGRIRNSVSQLSTTMPGVGVLLFVVVGVAQSWAQQYLNNRPFPTYSLENMPETTFSCRDKILGGYYADPDTQCQMFHICVKVAGVGVQDFRFLCPNGTAFDQDHQICAEWEDVDCDASTLYYSSDNFDLYRIGSGLESKSVKYGEDEETFALQRAETGDARLNREPQSGIVNQKKEQKFNYQRPKPAQNNDREIFKASSSSNFFNNRNNGKERDEDYDDNVNLNQDRDNEQRRKVVRNRGRKPSIQTEYNRNEQNRNVQANNRQATQNEDHNQNRNNDHNRNNNYNNQNNNYRNQNADYNRQSQTADFTRNTPAPPADYSRTSQQSQTSSFNQNTADYTPRQQSQAQTNTYKQNTANTANAAAAEIEAQTRKPSSRPTGFLNNFAGSSYVPTTLRPLAASTTINSDQYTTAINNYRARNGQKPRPQQTNDYTAQTPQYTVSTPAPFKSTQYRQISTFAPTKDTDNYPKTKPSTTERYNQQATNFKQNANPNDYKYELTKTKPSTTYPGTKTENYPSNNPQYFDKKPTTPVKQTETFPTTLSTKPKPFSANTQTFPTTFAPRTNAAYTQIAQQTLKQQSSTLIATEFVQTKASTTSKAVTSTPYTPTVPKISPTTPIARAPFVYKEPSKRILNIRFLADPADSTKPSTTTDPTTANTISTITTQTEGTTSF
ncbi:unnamed protein product [Acanthoscelides obtectus]|uniref:Chitin-binding type-2 domain-containing protein n=1 Tax=Acanthoscelides obtectus TaxID=200917 RepID=A0A9P0L2P8_ACAOB|nr:unnamed protein product [Acanthoscelides obtectus]CAK1626852.1 hypothetical protein AOBTE_LOCUS4114 [Acanthoscelides obtectus]